MNLTRRNFILTTLAASVAGCRENTAENTAPAVIAVDLSQGGVWGGIGFGTDISIEMWGVSQAQGNDLMRKIELKIAELEQCYSLYLEHSELRTLNRNRVLARPSPTFLDILKKAKTLSNATLGYMQPAIHHLWQQVQQKLSQIEPPETNHPIDWSGIPKLKDHWNAASMRHLQIKKKQIKLTNPLTQISLNAIGQGYATDIVASMLRSAGVTSAKIDCGETYCIGNHPESRPWKLGIAGNNHILGFIELSDTGLAVSSSSPNKVLLDPIKKRVVPSLTTAAITSNAGATTADAFATAFAVAPTEKHQKLRLSLQKLGKSQTHVW